MLVCTLSGWEGGGSEKVYILFKYTCENVEIFGWPQILWMREVFECREYCEEPDGGKMDTSHMGDKGQ